MIAVFIVILLTVAFASYCLGRLHERRLTGGINYRERWIEANQTLQRAIDSGEVEQKVISVPGPKDDDTINGIPKKAWARLSDYYRAELESSWMAAGNQPEDPLTGLSNYYVLEMTRKRRKRGFLG